MKNLIEISKIVTKKKVKKENISSVDDLDLSPFAEKYRDRLRETLRPHDSMWIGSLGKISARRLNEVSKKY